MTAIRLICICALSFWAWGCDDDTPDTVLDVSPPDGGPSDGGPPDGEVSCTDDDREEDDDFDEAGFAIPGEGPIDGVVCPDDEDIVAFEADAPCPTTITLAHSIDDGDLDLLVVDGFGDRIASGDTVTDDELVEVRLPEAGEYYVIIYGYDGSSAGYTLTIDVDGHDGGDGQCVPADTCSVGYAQDDVGDCFDCAEGYHDGGDGSCVPLGACARGHGDGGDGTCWPLGLCAPGHHPSLDFECAETAVCDEGQDDGTGACADACATGYHDDGEGICVPANTCAVGYQDGGDGACQPLDSCVEPYTPNASGVCLAPVDCEDDALDAGDGFDTAGPLDLTAIRYGVICPGDVDLYGVDLDTPCPTAVTVRFAHDEGDVDVEWVEDLGDRNDLGETRAAADSATDDEVIQWTGAGRYYVRIFGYTEDDSARYAVRIDAAGHDGGDGTCTAFGACAEGYAIDPQGACTLCAEGFNPGGDGSCVRDACADGFHDGGDGRCVPVGRCSPGHNDDGSGTCAPHGACAAGYGDPGDGRCAPTGTCLSGRVVGPDQRCVCDEGTRDGGGGACTPPGVCADGYHDGGDGACVAEDICSPGAHRRPGLRCAVTAACADDTRDDGTGACGADCADGYHDGGDGTCMALDACSRAFHDGGDGTCLAIDTCAEGFAADAAGLCHGPLACPADDGAEPDDAWRDARPIDAGDTARAIICAGDPDLFVVERRTDCALVARLDFDGRAADLSLTLLAGPEAGVEGTARGPLASSHDDENRERLVIPPGPEGPVYLRVRALADDSAAYRLRIDTDAARCARAVECAPPTRPDGAGGCGEACAPGLADGGDGTCLPVGLCAFGFHDGGDGRCIDAATCIPGYRLQPGGVCGQLTDCPEGRIDDGLGMCVDEALGCAAGFGDGGGGLCVALGACAPGFRDDGTGACQPAGRCGDGFAPDARNTCLPDLACPGDDPAEAGEPILLRVAEPAFGITCGEDGDRFTLDIPPACLLRVVLDFSHEEGDLALALRTPDGEVLDRVDSATDGEVLVPGDLDDLADLPLELLVEPADGTRYAIEATCD